MNQIKCINCGFSCHKYGKTRKGTQRWQCPECKTVFTNAIDRTTKHFHQFIQWLLSGKTQDEMSISSRTFRRNTAQFWEIWPMPPKVEEHKDIVFVDGIYLGRKACVLICCDETHVLGWYVCRYEHTAAWEALLQRIASPNIVVTDGGTGFKKACKKIWKRTKVQRCLYHVYCQVKRYTTSRPKTLAGIELYVLAKDLLTIHTEEEIKAWEERLQNWSNKHKIFLSEMTQDEYGTLRPKHERLVKAERSLWQLVKQDVLFTYLKDTLANERALPATNNRIEGGINAQLRAMLRDHRGLSIERRIKAVFWWCYMHSPHPLPYDEIIKVMPTDKSIAKIYKEMSERQTLEEEIPTWGDAIVWSDLHNYDMSLTKNWD